MSRVSRLGGPSNAAGEGLPGIDTTSLVVGPDGQVRTVPTVLDGDPLPVEAGGTAATSAAGARTSLGLGGAAVLPVGTTAGTVAAGDDSRIVGALSVATAATTYAPAVVMPLPSGDTTGATDSAAVQAAINAAAAGSEVVFRPGTYWFDAMLVLKSGCRYRGANKSGTTLKQAAGVNATSFVATAEWANNLTTSGAPTVVEYLTIDCNGVSNTGTYGIVLMNYRSVIQHCTLIGPPGDGIVFSDRNYNGVSITNTAVENRILHNLVVSPGGVGIMVVDSAAKLTDGHCFGNEVETPTGTGIQIDRAAGWFISQNHVYGCRNDGIIIDAVWGTTCVNNEVDGFGLAGAAVEYHGLWAKNIIQGRPSFIIGNMVATTEQPASTYWYNTIRTPAGVTATVTYRDNISCKDGGTSVASFAYTYQASATSSLTVQQSNNLVFGGITTTLQTGGGGTINVAGVESVTGDLLPASHIIPSSALAVTRFNGANSGSGAPASTCSGVDLAGTYSWGTGSGATAGDMGGITFTGEAFGAAPRVFVQPRNAVTAALGIYPAPATWGIVFNAANAPASGQPADTYSLDYWTVGG